jgi:hypothetical protein
VFLITFSKADQEDIVLTEDDLFDFQYEASCYSGESFELGGVNAKTLYLLIDNNTQRFSRGTFANCRVKLEIDGKFFGYYNSELPKRRNGVIELTAYDDMVKLDTEFPTDYIFPQTFWAVYAQCVFEAGLASEVSFDNVVLNGVWDNGIISADYTQYIYANSCRNLVAGMAEWNGGFAYINDDNKLQIDKFSKTVTREYSSGDLMELDYSDETVTFSKVKTSQKNKTYEMGTDSGYTLVIKNQYISYGLDDTMFETYLTKISEYYTRFTLTPMSFTLAEPDFDLRVGDRIQVYDEEEQVTITGNVSKIVISGNCSMTVTCGGFENVSSTNGFTPTSYSQVQQSKQEAKTSSQTAGGTLNEYIYLTDTSVKFNDKTYTIEKDADTGLISKISDSAGNEFEPEISAGITDVATHNAVFWAVAMCKGLRQKPYGNTNIFDLENASAGLWKNTGDGYDIILPGEAEISSEGVSLNQYYDLPITGDLYDHTILAVAKKRVDFTSSDWTTVIANYGTPPQSNLCTRYLKWSVGAGSDLGYYWGSTSAADYAIITMHRLGTKGVFYVNGVQQYSYSSYAVPRRDFWAIGKDFWFKHISIIPKAMSDDELAAEVQRLSTKYKIGGNP